MTGAANAAPAAGHRPVHGGPGISSQLPAWLDRIDLLETDAEIDEVLLAELQTAAEELRVADEELHVQHAEVLRLTEEVELTSLWRERLVAALPVPVLETDGSGLVVAANAAAVSLLGHDLVRLVGKPLAAYVDAGSRSDFRAMVTRSSVVELGPTQFTVVPRRGRPVQVHATAVPIERPGRGTARVAWTLLPVMLLPAAAEAEGVPSPVKVATAFAELTRLSGLERPLPEVLRSVVQVFHDLLPDTALSITLGSPASPDAIVTDSAMAQSVDGAQMQVDEGPCLSAWRSRSTVRTGDLAADHRWPALAERAEALGVRSVVAAPVLLGDDHIGALNVYASARDAFGDPLVGLVELVSEAVAAIVHTVRQHDDLRALTVQLETALQSRAVIDQAKGIVMARRGGDADEAFRLLSAVSQRHNVKVRELARLLVEEARQRSGRSRVLDVHDEDRA